MDEFLENSLMHFANPYYNPAKAHEYYMRTRKLKGYPKTRPDLRKPHANSMPKLRGDLQRATWRNSSAKLKGQQKAAQLKAKAAHEANLRGLVAGAQKKASAISSKIQQYADKKMGGLGSTVPSGLTYEQQKQWLKSHAGNMQKIRGDQHSDMKKAVAQVSSDLKSAVSAAKSAYAASKKKSAADYKAKSLAERNRIATKVAVTHKPRKGRKKGTGTGKGVSKADAARYDKVISAYKKKNGI